MKLRFKLPVLLLVFSSLSQADPIIWDANGHEYEVITGESSLTWAAANALAEAMGGHLVTITSAGENDFVSTLVSTYGTGNLERYWLGGYQTDDSAGFDQNWVWVTGETWSYTNWAAGEPNDGGGRGQDYLHYWPSPGLWDDMENRDVMDSFVIEYSVPEPGALALFGIGLLGLAVSLRRRRSVTTN